MSSSRLSKSTLTFASTLSSTSAPAPTSESASSSESPVPSIPPAVFPLTATVDLDAVVANAKFFADLAPNCLLMGVVKANGYGHGMLPVARALRLAGVSWFGVSHLDEAILLRQKLAEFDDSSIFSLASPNGFPASLTLGEYVQKPRILTWLADYGQDLRAALVADLDLSVSSEQQLHAICEAAASLRVQELSSHTPRVFRRTRRSRRILRLPSSHAHKACSHPKTEFLHSAYGSAHASKALSHSARTLSHSQKPDAGDIQSLADCSEFLPARIHLKVDVGMSRGGVQLENLPKLVSQIVRAEQAGLVSLESVWGHLNCADDPDGAGEQVTRRQIRVFHEALAMVESAGLTPKLRHLAATAGSLWYREAHFDLIRPGVGLYGLSPNPDSRPEDTRSLQPAMTLSSRLIQVKRLQPGQGVSYGATFVAERAQWVGLLPCGYGDGIARQASNRAPLWVNGQRSRILGRVCMDQIVIDLGQGEQPWGQPGDEVVLFGSAQNASLAASLRIDSAGENFSGEGLTDSFPTADEWAKASDTINYTVTTCLPAHVRRVYTGRIAKLLGLEN